MKKLFLIFLLLFLITSYSFCARPLITDDAYTLDETLIEVRLGYKYSEKHNNNNYTESIAQVKHGLSDRLDVLILIPYESSQSKVLGPSQIGMKFSLFRSNKYSGALTFTSELNDSPYIINGILTREFETFISHFNIGYQASGKIDQEGIVMYSLALEIPSLRNLNIALEVLGATYPDDTSMLEGLVGGSLNYGIIALDFGVSFNINNSDDLYKLILGTTVSF